jgi:hypothetical protein
MEHDEYSTLTYQQQHKRHTTINNDDYQDAMDFAPIEDLLNLISYLINMMLIFKNTESAWHFENIDSPLDLSDFIFPNKMIIFL